MAKKVILNIIREVSKFDFVDYPNKKRAPKNAKFKIVFYKPPPKENTNIPKKFQGVQYFTNKNDAKIALKKRKELTITLKEKKKKDMLGNNRNPEINKLGVKFGIDKAAVTKEVAIEHKKKVNRSIQLLKKGYSKTQINKIIIDEFNLERSEDSWIAPYIYEAEDLIGK